VYNIHVTRKEEVIDLLSFTDEEFAFYNKCLAAYETNMPYGEYIKLVQNPGNPVMKGSYSITKEIYNSPLFRALWDLGRRLAMRQGIMAPDSDSRVDIEPAQEDEFVSPYEAAKRIGVTAPAIHAAIRRGEIAAHQEKNGRWKVSVRSLEQYKPDPVRQAAPSKNE